MKKMLLVFGMCFFVLGLIAQEHKNLLEDQLVEPPKFSDEITDKKAPKIEKAPLCCFIENELICPDVYLDFPPEGIVGIEFTINPNGKVSNFKVVNPVDYHLEQAVINCLKQTNGMWTPGKVNGQYSAMEKRVYVKFDIEGNRSFDEISRGYYYLAVKKFYKGKNTLENKLLSTNKKEKRSDRMFKSSLAYLEKATVFNPNDATLEFWKSRNYEMLDMPNEMHQALRNRRNLLSQEMNNNENTNTYELAVITFK